MANKLQITLAASVAAALDDAGLDVPRVIQGVNSALGELTADSPVVKVGKARATKETAKKPSLFKISQTEKQGFEGRLTAPLRFYLWNEAILSAELAVETDFPVSIPEEGKVATWLTKFAVAEEKAA